MSPPGMMTFPELPPLPVDPDAARPVRPAGDEDFVGWGVAAELALRALTPEPVERSPRAVPAATPDDFAGLGGLGGEWAAAVPRRVPARVVREEDFCDLGWPDDAGLLVLTDQPQVVRLTPDRGRLAPAPRRLARPTPGGRLPAAKPRRPQPPRPVFRAEHPIDPPAARRPSHGGLWLMFSSALTSVVLFLLGAILLGRSAAPPAPPSADAAPPAAAQQPPATHRPVPPAAARPAPADLAAGQTGRP